MTFSRATGGVVLTLGERGAITFTFKLLTLTSGLVLGVAGCVTGTVLRCDGSAVLQ